MSKIYTELQRKFPELFAGLTAQQVSCNDGWYALLNALCDTIQQHINVCKIQSAMEIAQGDTALDIPDCRITQIKEKFGTLRFYYVGGDDYIHGAVDLAEQLSVDICEDCGAPGKECAGEYIRTLCDSCEGKYAV